MISTHRLCDKKRDSANFPIRLFFRPSNIADAAISIFYRVLKKTKIRGTRDGFREPVWSDLIVRRRDLGSLVPVFLSPDGKVALADPLAHRYMTFHDPVIQVLRSLARSLSKCGFFSSSREMKKILLRWWEARIREPSRFDGSIRCSSLTQVIHLSRFDRALSIWHAVSVSRVALSFYRFDSSAREEFRFRSLPLHKRTVLLLYCLSIGYTYISSSCFLLSCPSLFVLFLPYSLV